MPTTRTATTHWEGTLFEGAGQDTLESSGIGTYDVSWPSRAEEPNGKTSPEELIAAAHAGGYSMAFSHGLAAAGHTPTSVRTTARVHLEQSGGGFAITRIELDCEAQIPGIDEATFSKLAEEAKKNCPVSKALAGTEITLNARLV